MPFTIKGVPRYTCYYRTEPGRPNAYQADCNKAWIVLQVDHINCTFCGKIIERDPPINPRNVL